MIDPDDATIDQIVKLYDRHDRRTTRVQRLANRMTSALGTPVALVAIFGLAIAWTVGNSAARLLGYTGVDAFPFPDLEFIATIAALLVALLILTTQRHEEALAENRAQLTLQLTMLTERKIAKVIALLEEQRRDNPLLPTRPDAEAADMAQPSDHDAMLERIDETDERRLSE